MSDAPQGARYAIIAHVVHLVNRDYQAMCRDYYTLDFMDPSVDTTPIAPALAAFFDNVLGSSVSQLNFRAIVDGLGGVLFQYPFRQDHKLPRVLLVALWMRRGDLCVPVGGGGSWLCCTMEMICHCTMNSPFFLTTILDNLSCNHPSSEPYMLCNYRPFTCAAVSLTCDMQL